MEVSASWYVDGCEKTALIFSSVSDFSSVSYLDFLICFWFKAHHLFLISMFQRSELHNVIFVTRIKIWVQNFTPKTRKLRLFVFTTKHKNPLLFGLTREVSGVKLSQLNGFLNKDLHSVKNAYVSPKKFTPDLQIFYTFPVFGLNVCSCWG